MSQQHQKWIDLVKKRLRERGWSQSDFATVLGVSPAMVTRLLVAPYTGAWIEIST